jgi:hypothetical protein
MSKSNRVTARSEDTNTHYPCWDDLLAAEASGYVVVAVMDNGKESWPWVEGPYSDEKEAKKAQARLRSKLKRQMKEKAPETLLSVYVRPLWKDEGRDYAAVAWLHRRLFDLYPLVDGYEHKTASDEVKWEVDFLIKEIERKGYRPIDHLLANERNSGWGWLDWFYGKDGNLVPKDETLYSQKRLQK